MKTEYLIDGMLPVNVNAMVYADEAACKSLVVLDVGLTIAGKRETWQGREVKHGPVVYVVAENENDQPKRIRGWMQTHGELPDDTPFHVHMGAVNLYSGGGMDALLADIAAMPVKPVLVIFDTLHACMVGGNEKDEKDGGLVIDRCNQIRQATEGATVLLVHHTGKAADAVKWQRKGAPPRGSSALIDACTTRIEVTRTGIKTAVTTGDTVTLTCRKMNSGEGFSEIALPARVVTVEHNGETATTIAFADEKRAESDAVQPLVRRRAANVTEDDILAFIRERGTATKEDVCNHFGIVSDTAYRKLKGLVDRRLLTEQGGVYEPVRIAA